MRKFSVAFRKLFREISHFFREIKWSENEANFCEICFRENAKISRKYFYNSFIDKKLKNILGYLEGLVKT